jgi:Ig domain of plant-specific actin-binding protein
MCIIIADKGFDKIINLLCYTISGATRPIYSPDPYDVGRFLEAEISSSDAISRVSTTGPIDPGYCSELKGS